MTFGWRPEPVPSTDAGVRLRSMLGLCAFAPLDTSPPPEVDLLDGILVSPAYQRHTSSCVAHAVSTGVELCGRLAGRDSFPRPSRRWIYRLARETHGEADVDGGTYVSAGLGVCARLGWLDETRMPWDDARASELDDVRRGAWLNLPPDVSQRRHAFDQAGTVDYVRLITVGEHAVETYARVMIASRYPIVFGAEVGLGYMAVNSWDPADLDEGPIQGGHAQLATGYDAVGVHVVNSWYGWGVRNRARVSWASFRRCARDMHAVRHVEAPTT